MCAVRSVKSSASPPSDKKWWERPAGIDARGIVVTVVGGLILWAITWAITRHYDKLPVAASTAQQQAPTSQMQSSPPQQSPPDQSQAQPQQKPKAKKHQSANAGQQQSTSQAPSQPTYSVTSPNGSIVNQNSPNYGTQTVNNVPPSRELSETDYQDFVAILHQGKGSGKLYVIQAGTSDDIGPLSYQMCDAAAAAGWPNMCPASQQSFVINNRLLFVKGIQCYSSDWGAPGPSAFKRAADKVHLGCDYRDGEYPSVSVKPFLFTFGPIVGVTIVIGSPK